MTGAQAGHDGVRGGLDGFIDLNNRHDGLAQSDSIIIHHCNLSDAYMIQQIRGKIQKGVPVLSIWIFDGKEIRQLFKY